MFQNCSWFEIFKIQLKCFYMGIQVSLEETYVMTEVMTFEMVHQ